MTSDILTQSVENPVFILGFIKRAQAYGLTEGQAIDFLKLSALRTGRRAGSPKSFEAMRQLTQKQNAAFTRSQRQQIKKVQGGKSPIKAAA